MKKAKGIFSLVQIRESEVPRMTIKYSKNIAIASVIALSVLMVAPAQAEDPVVPVATTSVATTGTIHILSRVINDNLGTKYPTDFKFSLKHWGTDVIGSPFIGGGAAGTTFVVEAGTYVVSTPVIDGYTGVWFNGVITNGFIDLEPGQEITIVRISSDNGVAAIIAPEPEPTTEDGGTLPATSTPWFNLLGVGLLVGIAGALGLRRSRISTK